MGRERVGKEQRALKLTKRTNEIRNWNAKRQQHCVGAAATVVAAAEGGGM